jgi:hypothetical protein
MNAKQCDGLFSAKDLFVTALNSGHISFTLAGLYCIFLEAEKMSYKGRFPFNPGSVSYNLWSHTHAIYRESGWKCKSSVLTGRPIHMWGRKVLKYPSTIRGVENCHPNYIWNAPYDNSKKFYLLTPTVRPLLVNISLMHFRFTVVLSKAVLCCTEKNTWPCMLLMLIYYTETRLQ